MTLDLDQIKRNRDAGFYTDAGVLDRLIEEVERLQADHAKANRRIVELLGENRALKAELRGGTAYGVKLAGEMDEEPGE